MTIGKTLLTLFFAVPAAALVPQSDLHGWGAPQVATPSAPVEVRAYPNPWRADRHAGHFITFDHLSGDATVKIFTVSAQHVRTLQASGDSVTWDLTTDTGASVASGLYLYLVSTNSGGSRAGKVAVIR